MIGYRGMVLAALIAVAGLPGVAHGADKVTVAALRFVSSAPLFIAAERGYYKAQGLEVDLKFFEAAQPVAVAIASGDADFGVTAFTAGFFNLAGKGALTVIGAQSREEKGFEFSAYLASPKAFAAGLTSPDKLKGHSFAMTTPGSSFHYMIGRLAEAKGWGRDGLQLRSLQRVPNMIGAIKASQVDATILPAHIAKPLAAGGGAHIIGWVHEHTPYALGGLFTSTRNVRERRGLVERFIAAYQKAAADYHRAMNARDAAGKRTFGADADAIVAIIGKYVPNQTPAKIRDAAPFVDPNGRLDVGDVIGQVAWYKAQGLVDAGVDAKAFIDTGLIAGHFNVPK